MPELRHLTRAKPVELRIDLGDDDTVTVVFDRNKVTPSWVDQAGRRDRENDMMSLPKALADVIVSWDVTDDGQVFAPTADNLAVFSYPVQKVLLERIMEASVPGETEGNASVNISSSPGMDSSNGPASRPNGLEPLLSPQPSASPSTR